MDNMNDTANSSLIRVPNYSNSLTVTGGHDIFLIDGHGNSYLDFTSGWNVTNLGWDNESLRQVLNQKNIPCYAPTWFLNESKVKLADSFSQYFNYDYKVLYGVSGSDAAEFALKAAIKHTKRNTIISFKNAYHGATLELLKTGDFAIANSNFSLNRGNFRSIDLPEFPVYKSDNYIKNLLNTINQNPNPAGIIMETVFTNPGIIFGDEHFYHTVYETIKAQGGMVIVDEVGTGFRRTGKIFAFEHFLIRPDIIILGKAITSGIYPMSAILVKAEFASTCAGMGFHSTYGGTPLGCEIANENFKMIRESINESDLNQLNALALDYVMEHFKNIRYFYAVRGKGLCIGIELRDLEGAPISNSTMEAIRYKCQCNGLIIHFSNYTSTFIVMPPLIISKDDLFKGLKILKESIISVCNEG